MIAPVFYSNLLDMDTARIATLLAPFLEQPLTPAQLERVAIYIELLQRWNARINLTAIRKEEDIVTRHFGESFFLARHVMSAHSSVSVEGNPSRPDRGEWFRAVDIGSGAGFPALPLKIWSPNIDLTLIESNQKKVTFLREVCRTLGLENVEVVGKRVEVVAGDPSFARTNLVTLRAVERFESILPHAESLLVEDGVLALLIGASQLPILAARGNLRWGKPVAVPNSESRVLSIATFLRSGKTSHLSSQ